jgi:integrase
VRTLRNHLKHASVPLPCYRIGGKVLVRRSEFDDWAQSFKVVENVDVDAVLEDVFKGLWEGRMGVRVRFHKGAWWVFVAYRNRRRSKRVGDRQSANRIAQKIRERLVAGDFQIRASSPPQTLEIYAHAWLANLQGNLKASTVRFYTENLERHILPILGTHGVNTICRADCRHIVTEARTKNLKLNTVKGIARTLSSLLSQAVEDEKLPANPALRMGRYLRRGDEPKPVVQVLSREEAALLVETAQREFPRWHSWILLALRTGLRLGEQIGLQWGDIDWNSRFVLVQRNIVQGVITSPKSHQRRRVDLSAQLVSALLTWKRHQQARSMEKGKPLPPWVFPSLEGTPLEERNIRHVFTRLLHAAGLRRIRIHNLRHTFALRVPKILTKSFPEILTTCR